MYKTFEAKQRLFNEIDLCLIKNPKPSEYLGKISRLEGFKEFPFNMALEMKETKQPVKYHPEGSVWNHTMMVVDQAAGFKAFAKNKRAFIWAAFLHDIGKPGTTKIRKGRITSYGHDEAGANLARLFLSEFSQDTGFIENTAGLVRWHMQVLYVVKGLPFADIEAMKREIDLTDAALIGLCDRLGREGSDEEAALKDIRVFLETLNKMGNTNI